MGARLENWDGVAERLRHDFTILRFDLRGHGCSDRVPGPYSIEMLAGDALSLADEVGFDHFHLAGHSLGGLIATQVALVKPARVATLGLLSTASGRTPEERARSLERMSLILTEEPGGHFDRSLERWFTPAFVEGNPEVIERYRARNRENDSACYAAAYRVFATTDFAEDLHRLSVPTLIITGEEDQGSSPRMSQLMHARIPGSELHILPGLRHSILVEAPELVAGVLGNFLSGKTMG